ncbi:MAG: hypothetical protein QG599_1285 [Pseudomonadota bacterium]|nr:hypothetical protein [Pseudomonadota bacterium]
MSEPLGYTGGLKKLIKRGVFVNPCLSLTCKAALLLTLSAGWSFQALAHEGEDHSTPEPVRVSVPGETQLAVSGNGSLFDAILKYRPFASGETVALTLYLVSAETNRPMAEAAISASLSEGDQTLTVPFTPKPGGPVGAYSATLTPPTAAPMSWLFEVTADGESDLIGVTGFQASRLPPSDSTVGKIASHGRWEVSPQHLAALVGGGVLLLIVAFVAGRLTARKEVGA